MSAGFVRFQGNYLIHHNPSAFFRKRRNSASAADVWNPLVPFFVCERLTGCLPQYGSPVKYSPESGLTDIETANRDGAKRKVYPS